MGGGNWQESKGKKQQGSSKGKGYGGYDSGKASWASQPAAPATTGVSKILKLVDGKIQDEEQNESQKILKETVAAQVPDTFRSIVGSTPPKRNSLQASGDR